MLVFTPLAPADLTLWATAGKADITGFAATPAFLDAFGLGSPDSEDADLTLLELAGVAGLLAHGVRLVAVAEANAEPADPAEFGAVTAGRVRWNAVQSLFADDETGTELAGRARAAVEGSTLEQAWDSDEISDLLRGTELLWHGSSEWERLSH